MGHKRDRLQSLGWERPLSTYRPFLSYNELGALLDEGPSKLYDAVSSILGVEDLAAAERRLRDARLEIDRETKSFRQGAKALMAALDAVDDERATVCRAALTAKPVDVEGAGADPGGYELRGGAGRGGHAPPAPFTRTA